MIRVEDKPAFYNCVIISIDIALKIWAFIRLFADLVGIGYLTFFLLIFAVFGHGFNNFFTKLSITHLAVLIIASMIVDVGFVITLIVGLFKQSSPILRVIFYYEMYAIALYLLLVPLTIYVAVDPHTQGVANFICFLVIGVLVIVVEVFVFLGVKSKLILLRNRTKPECVRFRDQNY